MIYLMMKRLCIWDLWYIWWWHVSVYRSMIYLMMKRLCIWDLWYIWWWNVSVFEIYDISDDETSLYLRSMIYLMMKRLCIWDLWYIWWWNVSVFEPYRAVVSLCLLHGCFTPEAADEGSEERIDDGLQEAFINPQQHRNNDAGNTNHTWTQHMNITHITICTII